MGKQNLIFDFDDTMIATSPLFVEYINKAWNIQSTESDYKNNDEIHKVVQMYKNDQTITFNQVYDDYRKNFAMSEKWQDRIEPMPDMCKIVPLLSEKYNLHIATKRNNKCLYLIHKILDKYIPGYIESVYCAIKYTDDLGYIEMRKRDFILGLDGQSIAFVDDSKHEIDDVKWLIPSYLFDPKNKYGYIYGVRSIRSWQEIGEIFL